jgi:acyl carrier protein
MVRFHGQPTSQQVHDRLCIIASQRLILPPAALARLHPDDSLVEQLQLDSLSQVTLLAALEEDFGVLLEPEDRENIVTLNDLVAAIQERIGQSAKAASNGI